MTVLYASTIRPFDQPGLRRRRRAPAKVVVVEPYLGGTSAHEVAEALVTCRTGCCRSGCGREEVRAYGRAADHIARTGWTRRASGQPSTGSSRAGGRATAHAPVPRVTPPARADGANGTLAR